MVFHIVSQCSLEYELLRTLIAKTIGGQFFFAKEFILWFRRWETMSSKNIFFLLICLYNYVFEGGGILHFH